MMDIALDQSLEMSEGGRWHRVKITNILEDKIELKLTDEPELSDLARTRRVSRRDLDDPRKFRAPMSAAGL